MDDLKRALLEYSKTSNAHITTKELNQMLRHIDAEAREYYAAEFVDEAYLDSLIKDIRNNTL
jgi:hypothetical protein